MPADRPQKYFDLSRLQPLLEQGHLLLTPNQRFARRIKSEWDRLQIEAGKSVWQPVAVRALDHWLQECWQLAVNAAAIPARRPLSSIQEKELWSAIIAQDRQANGDYSLLQTSSAADLAMQARSHLLRAGVDMQQIAVTSEFSLDEDCSTFQRWLTRFESIIATRDLAVAEDRWLQLLETPQSSERPNVVLVDFDDLPNLHRQCVERLAATVQELASADSDADVVVHSYADRQQELAAVAQWTTQEYQRDPDCRLGILLADMNGDRAPLEYLLRREFNCLGDNYNALPVNFSTGITLERAPVVRDALRMLGACGETMAMKDLLALINTRFAGSNEFNSDRVIKLLQQIFDDGVEQLELGRVRFFSRSVKVAGEQGLALGDKLAACSEQRLLRVKQPPSDWVKNFGEVLDIWGWPGKGPLDSLEYQQVEAWYKVLEDYAGLDAIADKVDLGEALKLLRRCCQNRISQPQTADTGIQVLGPLEAAGLQFDSVWFCGLQGGRWPAPSRPNPFIPMVLQRKHSMPHSSSEREWAYAETLMGQYRAGCKHLTATYSRQLDGVPELPSPLLEDWPIEDIEATSSLPESWLEQASQARLETVNDTRAPSISAQDREKIKGGSGILQQQANCPFRAFASKRLFIEPLGEYHAGLTAADRGSILHDALYALWGEIQDSTQLSALDAPDLEQRVAQAVSVAIEAVPDSIRQLVGMHCLDLEHQRLQKLLIEWIEIERARDAFKVVSREEPIEFQLDELSLNLRVDRVDELEDGSRIVIDYKSGRSSLADWLGARPSQPQLPLYGLAEGVNALAFAQVRTRDCRMLGLGSVDGLNGVQSDIHKAVKRYSSSEDWDSLVAEWRQNLTRLAAEFLAGEAQVDPLPAACNYCGLQPLCRVDVRSQEIL
ncbi:MAG: PD-(D/E)XK nuclease family protein [Halioglobus sp.]